MKGHVLGKSESAGSILSTERMVKEDVELEAEKLVEVKAKLGKEGCQEVEGGRRCSRRISVKGAMPGFPHRTFPDPSSRLSIAKLVLDVQTRPVCVICSSQPCFFLSELLPQFVKVHALA